MADYTRPEFGEWLNSGANNYVPPPLPAPVQITQPAPPTPAAMAPQTMQPSGPGLVSSLAKEWEAKLKKPRLDENDLTQLGEYIKLVELPKLAQGKGLQQWEFEGMQKGFDQQYAQFVADYLRQPGVEGAAPADSGGGNPFTQAIAAPVSGLVDMAGGLASLADYGIRTASAAAQGTADLVTGKKKWSEIDAFPELMQAYGAKPTAIGDIASGIGQAAQDIRNKYYTEGTLKAQNDLSDAMQKGDYATMGKLLIMRPDIAATFAGEMIGGIGGAGQLTKIPKYAALVKGLSEANAAGRYVGRAAQILPSALGYAGQQGRQFEDKIRNTSIDELVANPEVRKIYEAVQAAGFTGDELANKTKDRIIATGIDDVLYSSLIANLALPAVGKLGVAERFFAAGGRQAVGQELGQGVARAAGRGAGREFVEEGLSSGIEQVGLNKGERKPLGEGVGAQVALGSAIGGWVGGSIGAVEGRRKPLRRTPTPTPSAETAPPVAPVEGAQAAPAAPATVAAPVDNPEFAPIQTAFNEAVNTNPSLTRGYAAADLNTAADLVSMAEEDAATVAGDAWATLSRPQQVQLISTMAEAANVARGKNAIEGVPEALAALIPAVAPVEAAPVEAAPVEAPVAPVAPESVEPDVPEPEAPTPAPVAAPAAPPVETTPAPVTTQNKATAPIKQQSPLQKEQAFYQGYLTALANTGEPTATDEQFRDDPHFKEMQAAMAAGKVVSPDTLKAQLAEARTRAKNAPPKLPIKTQSKAVNLMLIGELRAERSRTKAVLDGKKAANLASETLRGFGIKEEEIARMTLNQAQEVYDRLSEAGVKPITKTPLRKTGPTQKPRPVQAKPAGNETLTLPAKETATAQLPQELAGAKPRYSYGVKQFTLNFSSDIAKALFITSQKTPSKADAKYRKFLTDLGFTDAEISSEGAKVRDSIKAKAKDGKSGTTIVVEDSPSPKTQAPAQEAAGAAESNLENQVNPQPLSDEELAQHTDPEVVSSVVLGILGEADITNSLLGEVTDAVVMARLGENTDLNTVTKSLQNDGIIDLKQAMALRAAGKPITQIPASQVVTAKGAADGEVSSVDEANDPLDNTQYAETPQNRAILDEILNSDSKTKAADLLLALSLTPNAKPELKWLARKLAPLLTKFNVSLISAPEAANAVASYSRGSNSIGFRKVSLAAALHESIHAVTSNLLMFKAGQANPDLRRIGREIDVLLAHIQDWLRTNLALEDSKFKNLPTAFFDSRGPIGNTRELLAYAMTDRNVQSVLKEIPAPLSRGRERNTWQAFKNLVAKLFGFISPKQRSALDAIIESTGELVEFAERNPSIVALANNAAQGRLAIDTAIDPSAPVPEADLSKELAEAVRANPTRLNWFAARFVNATEGFEKVQQAIRRLGHSIPATMNLERAKVTFDGLRNEYVSQDMAYITQPIVQWLNHNLLNFGDTPTEALVNIDKFFRNKTQLNRYHMMWLQNVRLNAGRDVARKRILDAVTTAKTDEEIKKLRSELERIVSQHRAQTEEEYGTKFNPYYPRFREGLRELDAKGVNDASMAELNTLMQAARDGIQDRTVQAGKVDPTDPWIRFYNDKWYVPLKGDKEVDKRIADMDFGAIDETLSMRILSSQVKAAKGTRQPVTNTVERLLADLSIAGSRAAENTLTQAMYDFAQRFQKELGASIRVFEGRTKEGFTQIAGKKTKRDGQEVTDYKTLPGTEGFIYSNGRRHYIVDLPDGPLLRAVKGIYNYNESWLATKVAGKVTNLMSKSFTVWKPTWTLMTGLFRDVTYMPTMVAMRETNNIPKGLGIMGKYYINLLRNTVSDWGNINSAYNMVFKQSAIEMDKLAADSPESFAGWLRRYQRAGGGTNIRAMFNPTQLSKELTSAYSRGDGLYKLVIPARAADRYLIGWANLLENVSRVAAFRTLVENGDTDIEAAAKTKDVLNFDQQGVWSHSVNSYIAFFKVGMTSADAIRKTFTTPTGGFDKAKFTAWVPVMMAIGYMGMAMTRMVAGYDDDDGEKVEKLKKIDINNLTQNFIVYIDGKPHKFPIGLGMPQLLLGPGIIMEAMQNGDISAAEAGRAIYELLARNAPLRPGGLPRNWSTDDIVASWVTAFTPTPIAPAAQLSTNRNVFGQSIYTEHSRSDRYEADQAKPSTDKIWIDMAQGLRTKFGIDVHPESIKFMMTSYASQIPVDNFSKVSAAMQAEEDTGSVVRLATGQNLRDPEFYYRKQMYATKDDLLPAVRDYYAMKEQASSQGLDDKAATAVADRWLAGNATAKRAVGAYKALDSAERKYYKARSAITGDRTLSIERRDLMLKKLDGTLRRATEEAAKAVPVE